MAASPDETLGDTGARDSNGAVEFGRRFPAILCLDDFENAARHRLPKSIFGFYADAAESGASLRANREAFEALAFRTRVMVDVSARSQRVTLFDQTYASPFGIAPMGGVALCRFKGEVELARAAAAANLPFILSGASSTRLEEVRRDGHAAWFQAYLAADRSKIAALVERVANAGYTVLVVTADVAVGANRENAVRHGYAFPLRITPGIAMDGLMHPTWLLTTAARTLWCTGIPHFENMNADRGQAIVTQGAALSRERRDALCWEDLAWLRTRWPGRLVIKGVLSSEDAARARDAGVDGIIVSNHGGRQLDGALAPMRVLEEIVDAVGDLPIMLDGGVRRGTDVLKALALGARLVFVGRPFMYALAIGGEPGVRHAIKILAEEIDRDLALLGCTELASLHRGLITAAR